MFYIFNKQKIYSYVIAASTVVVLFVLSFFFINTDTKTKETSINTTNTKDDSEYLTFVNNIILNK